MGRIRSSKGVDEQGLPPIEVAAVLDEREGRKVSISGEFPLGPSVSSLAVMNRGEEEQNDRRW